MLSFPADGAVVWPSAAVPVGAVDCHSILSGRPDRASWRGRIRSFCRAARATVARFFSAAPRPARRIVWRKPRADVPNPRQVSPGRCGEGRQPSSTPVVLQVIEDYIWRSPARLMSLPTARPALSNPW